MWLLFAGKMAPADLVSTTKINGGTISG